MAKKDKKKNREKANPTTKVVVMITACLVTLIGVACGLEPDVILVRCLIACGLTGCVTHVSVMLVQMVIGPANTQSPNGNAD